MSSSLSCWDEPLIAPPALALLCVLAVLVSEVGSGKEGFLIDSPEDLVGATRNNKLWFELEAKV